MPPDSSNDEEGQHRHLDDDTEKRNQEKQEKKNKQRRDKYWADKAAAEAQQKKQREQWRLCQKKRRAKIDYANNSIFTFADTFAGIHRQNVGLLGSPSPTAEKQVFDVDDGEESDSETNAGGDGDSAVAKDGTLNDVAAGENAAAGEDSSSLLAGPSAPTKKSNAAAQPSIPSSPSASAPNDFEGEDAELAMALKTSLSEEQDRQWKVTAEKQGGAMAPNDVNSGVASFGFSEISMIESDSEGEDDGDENNAARFAVPEISIIESDSNDEDGGVKDTAAAPDFFDFSNDSDDDDAAPRAHQTTTSLLDPGLNIELRQSQEESDDGGFKFVVENIIDKTGVGVVASGYVLSGQLSIPNSAVVGPTESGMYMETEVKSAHTENRSPTTHIGFCQNASLALQLKRGMAKQLHPEKRRTLVLSERPKTINIRTPAKGKRCCSKSPPEETGSDGNRLNKPPPKKNRNEVDSISSVEKHGPLDGVAANKEVNASKKPALDAAPSATTQVTGVQVPRTDAEEEKDLHRAESKAPPANGPGKTFGLNGVPEAGEENKKKTYILLKTHRGKAFFELNEGPNRAQDVRLVHLPVDATGNPINPVESTTPVLLSLNIDDLPERFAVMGPDLVLLPDVDPWAFMEKIHFKDLLFLQIQCKKALEVVRAHGKVSIRHLQRKQGEYQSEQMVSIRYDAERKVWSSQQMRTVSTYHGCHAIAPLVCNLYMRSETPRISDDQIQRVIDYEAAVPAFEICYSQGQREHTFCEPTAANEYLESKGLLPKWVANCSGDITRKKDFQEFLRTFAQVGNESGKAACSFLVNFHVDAIIKSPHPKVKGESVYEFVHTIEPASISRCVGIQTLGAVLLEYATGKLVLQGEEDWKRTTGGANSKALFQANFFE